MPTNIATDRYANLSAEEAMAALPGDLTIPKGALRIHAHFLNGRLHGELTVRAIRVPGHHTNAIKLRRQIRFDLRLLEHAARELNLVEGEAELIIEYVANSQGKMQVHWVDFIWKEHATVFDLDPEQHAVFGLEPGPP